ncbi:MAG: sulfatase [archaeon]
MGLFLILGCGSQPVCEDCNVIIIIIDALRWDHLGCYGYAKNTSPTMDSLCRNSIVFENAISQGTSTARSVASLFTSNYANTNGLDGAGGQVINHMPDSAVTIAEVFRSEGYSTGAIIGATYIDSDWGYDQGYDDYKPANDDRVMTEMATEWINDAGGKFFLYLHLFSPHAPYDPPKEYKDLFRKGYNGSLDFSVVNQQLDALNLTQEDINELRDRYDGEIRYADDAIGSLLGYLRGAGLLENTIIAVTADHGEALREKMPIGHGHDLNTVVQVPLIVYIPGEEERRIERAVELIDLPPGLLKVLQIDIPESFKGDGLFTDPGKRFAFSQGHQVLIRDRDCLFINHQMYNLTEDPYQLHPLNASEAFEEAYWSFNPQLVLRTGHNEETKQKMRSLGYV